MHKSVKSHRPINLEIALGLATVGLPILPAGVFWNQNAARWRKQPLVNQWQKVATCDPLQIRKWWRAHPAAVPGIELGQAGLLVIDADRDLDLIHEQPELRVRTPAAIAHDAGL